MGACSDHITNSYFNGDVYTGVRFNIDLTDDGCIRFHANGGIRWDSNFVTSTMTIEKGEVSEDIILHLRYNMK